MKDWTGNHQTAYSIIGASNHSLTDRAENDYYATEPKALELLLDEVTLSPTVWECACGQGHLSEVLKERGYKVYSSDLVDRGYGTGGIDFLQVIDKFDGDIVTNPPYAQAQQFVEHALELVPDGRRVVMFLKLTFLESKARRKLFEKYPPEYIYVSSSRLQCARNGDFETYHKGTGTAIAYGWYIWTKGFTGEPKIKWFN